MNGIKEFDFSRDAKGVRVVLRAGLNSPLDNGKVTNAYRIIDALKTIEKLSARGVRTVVLAHIGREKTMSLKPVWEEMKKHTQIPIKFVEDVANKKAKEAVESLQNGEVVLLENVRREQGEKECDSDLVKTLASYGDVFINDAFADSHRSHASVVGIPELIPGYAGPNFIKEAEGILPARTPSSPSIAVIGGAKFLTKEPLIIQLLETYDKLFIGGALANDFLMEKGFEVGKSLVSRSPHIKGLLKNSKIILPEDVVVLGPDGIETKSTDHVGPNDIIYDVGPKSVAALTPHIEKANFILWNGPLGHFENGYVQATESLAKVIANANGHSVVGGGDTVTAINNLNIFDQFDFVSTAGGAMLDFISNGTIAGMDALAT